MDIAAQLQAKREQHASAQKKQVHSVNLAKLRNKLSPGSLSNVDRKKKEQQLTMLLKNALFLREDEERRKRWLASVTHLPDELLNNLIGAVIRENFRYKKGKRNLVVELNNKNVYGQK